MKAKRIFLAVLLTAALSVSSAAPAVLAESPAAPEVTTITVFRPNLGRGLHGLAVRGRRNASAARVCIH